jgi:carboxymethylenebutenolidase
MNDFQRYLAEEFAEDYHEGRLSRRQTLKLIASVLGNVVVAQTFLAACAPSQATTSAPAISSSAPTATAALQSTPLGGTQAAEISTPTVAPTGAATNTAAAPTPQTAPVSGTVSPDDPAVEAGPAEIPAADTTLFGYLARPAAEGTFPVILVCHENRGLTPHIEDVTRRLAKAGYVGLAVDLLSRQGGTTALGSDAVPGALGNIAPEQFVEDFLSGWRYLQRQAFAQTERVGMTGFCFGGGVTWRVAAGMPELLAAVPFYGPPPAVEDVRKINAAVLAIYGELDQRINQSIPAIEAAMLENNKIYEKVIYPNADHAFHNDTGSRYNPEAAQDAWARTLAWFEQYVRAS